MTRMTRTTRTKILVAILTVLSLASIPTAADAVQVTGVLDEAADGVLAPAVRIDPPIPSFATNCEEMSWYRERAGLPAAFDSIGWRESNCRNEDLVRTWCCYGWWQLYVSEHLNDPRMIDRYHACGVYSAQDVNSDSPEDKTRQACATKVLYDEVGFQPWKT